MFNMYKKIALPEGRRFTLESTGQILQLVSGSAEVYYMRGQEGVDYQQLYLMTVGEGHLVFGLPEQDDEIRVFVSALEDSELGFVTEQELLAPEPERQKLTYLRRKMNQWFYSTMDCRWLRYSNIYGSMEQVECPLEGATPEECIWNDFKNSQQLLLAATKKRFQDDLKSYEHSLRQKAERSDNLMLGAAANLLHTEKQNLSMVADALEDSDKPVLLVAKMLVRHFGLEDSSLQLPEEVAEQLDDVSLLRRLLQKAGIYVRLVKPEQDWFKKDNDALIGLRKDTGELVALLPDTVSSYVAYSSSTPLGEPVNAELAAELQTEYFACHVALLQPRLKLKGLLAFAYNKIWGSDLSTIVVVSFLAGLIPLLVPLITETIFSDIIPINDRQALSTVTQIILISAFTTTGIDFVRNIAILRIKNRADMSLSSGVLLRVLSLPTAFFRKFEVGDLLTRIESVHSVCDTLLASSVSAVFNVLFSFWSLGLMLFYSMKLTLAALVLWVIYMLFVGIFYYNMVRYNRKMIEATGQVSGTILQIFNGLNKFRVDGAEAQAYSLWARLFGRQWHWGLKNRWQGNYLEVVNTIQSFVMPLLIYALAMYWSNQAVAAGNTPEMDYARFLAFQAAFSSFNSVIISVAPMVSSLLNIKPQLERVKPLLEQEPEIVGNDTEAEELRGDIALENVSFRYHKEGSMVIDNLSLHIRSGESVALVGSSGCGKSTLVRLLLGFERPEYGAVYYDSHNLNDVNVASVRRQLGVVLQNGQLLTGSIFENIVGSLPLTREDAWRAAVQVGLDKDVQEMPMGLETIISEGAGNISGGQKQRVLLARALVNKPKIIIMDEATSALDNITQKKVADSIDALRATRIIVAHRLSTVQNADRILVMDKGKIAEEGSFSELMQKSRLFAELAKRQLA